jgi:hypothetical protein
LPCAGVNLSIMLMPHRSRGHNGAISCTGCAGAFVLHENFYRLHMWRRVLLHHRLLLANKNPARGPWQVGLWHLCGLRKFLREYPTVSLDPLVLLTHRRRGPEMEVLYKSLSTIRYDLVFCCIIVCSTMLSGS